MPGNVCHCTTASKAGRDVQRKGEKESEGIQSEGEEKESSLAGLSPLWLWAALHRTLLNADTVDETRMQLCLALLFLQPSQAEERPDSNSCLEASKETRSALHSLQQHTHTHTDTQTQTQTHTRRRPRLHRPALPSVFCRCFVMEGFVFRVSRSGSSIAAAQPASPVTGTAHTHVHTHTHAQHTHAHTT